MYTHKFRVKNDGVTRYESIRPYTYSKIGTCEMSFNKYTISALYAPFIRGNDNDKGWIDTPRWYESNPYGIDYIEIGIYDKRTKRVVSITYNPFMDGTKLIRMI